MDLWTALFTVFRRWYVSLPIAVLAVVGMVVIGGRIAQEYEAHASVVLVPPPAKVIGGIERRPDNPLDAKTAATATAKQIDSTSTQRRFEDDGLSPDFEVNLDSDTAIIEYLVTAETADQALETAQRLIDETKGNLARIQQIAGAQDDALITLNTVDISDEAEPIEGDKLRVQATVLLLGLVAAVSAAFIVESFQARRRGGGRGAQLATPGAGVPVLTGYPMPPMSSGYAVAPPGNGMPGTYPAMGPLPAGYVPVVPVAQAPLPAEADAPARGRFDEPEMAVPGDERPLFGSVDDLLEEPDASNGLANGHGNARRSSPRRPINTGKRAPGRDDLTPQRDVATDRARDAEATVVEDVHVEDAHAEAVAVDTVVEEAPSPAPFDADADPVAGAELVTDVEPVDSAPGSTDLEAAPDVDGTTSVVEEVIDLTEAEAPPEPDARSGPQPDAALAPERSDDRSSGGPDVEPDVADVADDAAEEASTEPVVGARAAERANQNQDRPRSGGGTGAAGRPSRARRGGAASTGTKRQPRTDHNSGTAGKERRSSLFASGNDGPPAGNDG